MMNETGIRPQIIQEIKELAQKYGIQKVILFGSRARGDYRKVSDIDLAVSGGNIAAFAFFHHFCKSFPARLYEKARYSETTIHLHYSVRCFRTFCAEIRVLQREIA